MILLLVRSCSLRVEALYVALAILRPMFQVAKHRAKPLIRATRRTEVPGPVNSGSPQRRTIIAGMQLLPAHTRRPHRRITPQLQPRPRNAHTNHCPLGR